MDANHAAVERLKKCLAVCPIEAELVCRLFRLYAEGEKGSGLMGTKKLALHRADNKLERVVGH